MNILIEKITVDFIKNSKVIVMLIKNKLGEEELRYKIVGWMGNNKWGYRCFELLWKHYITDMNGFKLNRLILIKKIKEHIENLVPKKKIKTTDMILLVGRFGGKKCIVV